MQTRNTTMLVIAAGLLLLGGTAQADLDPSDSKAGSTSISLDQRPCNADMNGDGSIGFFELNLLLTQWGACDDRNDDFGRGASEPDTTRCAADLDHDGHVGFIDLNLMISAWGKCDPIIVP